MIARQTAVQTAISMKGQRKQVADVYRSYRPKPLGYTLKDEDLMCAAFVSSIFIKLAWTDLVPPNPRAWQLYEIMAAMGDGIQDPKRIPDIGDLIFFGINKKTSGITHVGIVTEVKGTQIYYYDIQSVVGRHTCPVGYSTIWGYAVPKYYLKDGVAPQPEPEPDAEPVPEREFAVGDLVTVNPGAKWYKGQSIKLSVINDQWYIMQVSGDRAVLGMNKAETRCITSPIHTADITLVWESEPEPAEEKVTLTVTVDRETAQLLQIMADGAHITIGEVVDMLLEDAR